MNQSSDHKELAYEAPQALRLGGGRAGAGGFVCDAPGSGDPGCQTGNDASSCEDSGSAATQECDSSGSGAIGDCTGDGSGTVQ